MTRIIFIFLLLPEVVFGSLCFYPLEEEIKDAQFIFEGKCISISRNIFWLDNKPKNIFTFSVNKIYKGDKTRLQIISILSPIKGPYDEGFIKDSTYLVFAHSDCPETEIFYSNDCSNTDLIQNSRHKIEKLPAAWDIAANEYFVQLAQKYGSDYDENISSIDLEEMFEYLLNQEKIKRVEAFQLQIKHNALTIASLKFWNGVLIIGLLILTLALLWVVVKKRNANNGYK